MSVDRKYERDVDLLLAKFSAIRTFADKFKSLTKFAGKTRLIRTYQKAIFRRVRSHRRVSVRRWRSFRFLIEDKVDAPLQPDQATRYRKRAEQDRSLGIYNDFEVVLCAPSYYITDRSDLMDLTAAFHSRILQRSFVLRTISERITEQTFSKARARSESTLGRAKLTNRQTNFGTQRMSWQKGFFSWR